MLPARCQPGDTRRFRVEDGRAQAHKRSGEQQHRVGRRIRQKNQTAQGGDHAKGQRIRLRPAVGSQANQRLQQRRRQLVGQRDEADLHEAQVKVALENRVHRQDQRLHHVIDHVRGADGAQHAVLGLGDRDGLSVAARLDIGRSFLEQAREPLKRVRGGGWNTGILDFE